MNYIQIIIASSNEQTQEIIIALLAENNFDGFETTAFNINAYIPQENFVEEELQNLLQPFNLTYTQSIIQKQNWNQVWESNFDIVTVDDFVGIRAHFHPPIQNVQHQIVITPKMSFGTGHHATTFTVMQLMQNIDFVNKTVFDFGTGTGILAILAEKLGASEIVAVDYDDWCIENSLENIATNNCSKISIQKADTANTTSPFDIVIANINKNIILDNAIALANAVTTKGKLFLSGLLVEDENDILQAMSQLHFNKLITKEKSGWIAILLEKN